MSFQQVSLQVQVWVWMVIPRGIPVVQPSYSVVTYIVHTTCTVVSYEYNICCLFCIVWDDEQMFGIE